MNETDKEVAKQLAEMKKLWQNPVYLTREQKIQQMWADCKKTCPDGWEVLSYDIDVNDVITFHITQKYNTVAHDTVFKLEAE